MSKRQVRLLPASIQEHLQELKNAEAVQVILLSGITIVLHALQIENGKLIGKDLFREKRLFNLTEIEELVLDRIE